MLANPIVWIIFFLIVSAVILYFVYYIVVHLPIDRTLGNIILALVAFLLLLYFLNHFGALGQLGSTWSTKPAASTWSTHRG